MDENPVQLTDEDLKRLQQIGLTMTEYFLNFCKKRAPDYEKLLEIWDREADRERYSLRYATNRGDDLPCFHISRKIWNPET